MECVPWQPNMGCAPEWDSLDSELQDRSIDLAWDAMRFLTGGMVGNCPVLYRPCVPEPCTSCAESWMLAPYLKDGVWHNTKCGSPGCSCVQLSEIVFPGRVADVRYVLLDGEVLDTASYRLDHNNRLLRTDGGVWPACQDMRMDTTQVGTYAVEYVPGVKPGLSGLWAVGVLTWEFSKACTGEKCRLPASVTSITRQGVSMQFDNSMFSNGQTGIREVDAYVLSVNPNRLKTPPLVWTPDVEHGRGTDALAASPY